MKWPRVLSEAETLERVLGGQSIARYGDGEFKLCRGVSIKSQPFYPGLWSRLREILHNSGDCLVGIPNLHEPTKPFWDNYRGVSTTSLLDMKRTYGSSFISRPDSAPWIHTPDYWQQIERLWKGRNVTLVRGSGKSLTAPLLRSADSVDEILCARQDAWSEYHQLLERIGKADRVLLCCGPAATVLAVDLAAKGIHAVDIGHIGMWFKRQQMPALAALQEGRQDDQ